MTGDMETYPGQILSSSLFLHGFSLHNLFLLALFLEVLSINFALFF